MPYKQEVAGSSPAPPISEGPGIRRFLGHGSKDVHPDSAVARPLGYDHSRQEKGLRAFGRRPQDSNLRPSRLFTRTRAMRRASSGALGQRGTREEEKPDSNEGSTQDGQGPWLQRQEREAVRGPEEEGDEQRASGEDR